MKKIGFVDYYLSEWHANNYPEFIANACKALGVDYKVAYAWAELDKSPLDNMTTAEWCEKYGAEKCDTLEELCEKSDYIVILAPSDPETHIRYARVALKYGKRTFIDKTFTTDYKTALEIFDIAEKNNTPFFSTSALRYAEELDALDSPSKMIIMCSGLNLPEYMVHMAELVVKKLGVGIKQVSAESVGNQSVMTVNYNDGKFATMIYGENIPYTLYMADGENEAWRVVESDFFDGMIKDILTFFETGKTSFDTEQTKEVMRLCEMALKAVEVPGTAVTL